MSFSGPLIDTDWLQEHLHDPDLRILDCSVSMQVTDNEYHFISGRDEYAAGDVSPAAYSWTYSMNSATRDTCCR